MFASTPRLFARQEEIDYGLNCRKLDHPRAIDKPLGDETTDAAQARIVIGAEIRPSGAQNRFRIS
ncbi:hypothetical protein A9W96_27665 [Mycobacterium sp. 1245852.3]|nr:hypothetical protein A9W96_27665 [Mycobacterium sp. 1245852.3]